MKVLLIGDLATDCFMEGECSRMSPEAPVAVMVPTGCTISLGMAGNVLNNLKSLCPEIEVKALLAPVVNMKVRYIDKKTGHHFLRVDEPDQCHLLDAAQLKQALVDRDLDAVVVSDYCKGYLNEFLLANIANLCEVNMVPWFLDTKRIIGRWAKGAILKINHVELENNLSVGVQPWEYVSACLVTNGEQGIYLYDQKGHIIHHVSGPIVEVRDGAGCGDTVLAALVVSYIENGFDLQTAMGWADKAGRVAVSKRGVVAVKREEV